MNKYKMSNNQKVREKGLLIILSSPSGAGKSTLAQRIKSWDENCVFSISATTRKPRKGEQDGKDYYFISENEFHKKVSNSEMLEHAEVFGNLYGSPITPVLSSIDNGNDVLFDVDWQGSQQIKNSRLGEFVLSIFILPPSIKELESRLKLRNQDSDEVILNRMAKSVEEISHWPEYDYVLVNDNIDETEEKLKTIINAERLRLSQEPGIVEFIRSLSNEFGSR